MHFQYFRLSWINTKGLHNWYKCSAEGLEISHAIPDIGYTNAIGITITDMVTPALGAPAPEAFNYVITSSYLVAVKPEGLKLKTNDIVIVLKVKN